MKIWSFLVLSITVALTCLSSDALAYDRYYGHSRGIHAGVGNLVRADVSGRGVHAGVGNLVRTDVSGRGIHAGVGNLIRVGVGGGGGRSCGSRGYGRNDRDYDDDGNRSYRQSRYRNDDRYDGYDDDYQPNGGYQGNQGGGGLVGGILNSVFGY